MKTKMDLIFTIILAIPFLSRADTHILNFKVEAGPFCFPQVSWSEVLADPLPVQNILDCLDEKVPLRRNQLHRQGVLNQLKNLKQECGIKWAVRIPEQLQWQKSQKLTLESLTQVLNRRWMAQTQNSDQQSRIQILKATVPPLDCDDLVEANRGKINIESKNFMRWNLETVGGPLSISAEFRVYKKVPVAKRQLSFADRVSAEDWEWAERDVTFINDLLLNPETFEGHSLARGIALGQTFSSRDLKREYLVEKQQMVKVRIYGTDFEITAQAQAESSGYQGDWVKLKNFETQKSFAGVVISRGVVEVR